METILLKIAVSPFHLRDNKYIEIIMDSIKSSGIEVCDYNTVRKDKNKMKEIDIINLNWFENRINSKYVVLKVFRIIYRTVELIRFKMYGTKIVYTLHNKIPHDIKTPYLSKLFIKIVCKLSDKIVMISSGTKDILTDYLDQEEIENKAVLIPHPNYIGAFKEKNIDYRSILKIQENELVLLFTGQVKPYKNIELLIKVADCFKDKPIKFIIAGKPVNNNYKQQILKLLSNKKNIIPLLYFIDNDKISSLIKCSDVMVFPYDIKSSLNSGNIIQSFSFGRTVISPYISTLHDFNDDLFFSYTYSTVKEHEDKLKQEIENVYEIYKKNPKRLSEMGKKLRTSVLRNNSKNVIKEKYLNLFNELYDKK